MRERELKLVVPESFQLPVLEDAIADATLSDPKRRQNNDVYLDTTDLRLARWGCTLRHREGGGWTVKIPSPSSATMLDREEVVFAGSAEQVPEEAVGLVSALTRGAELEVVARLSTRREARVWRTSVGAPVAELTDDVVETLTPAGWRFAFREIEVELVPEGDERVLEVVLARLLAAGASGDDATPKVLRVMGERAKAPPDVSKPSLPQHPTGAEVIRSAVAGSVVRLVTHLPAARLGAEPEGVHQARVATRRLRSDLKTFEPLLDVAWAAALREELSWLADELGKVRDADVLYDSLRALLERHPEIESRPGAIVLRELDAERRLDQARLSVHLGDVRVIRLLDHLVAAAASPVTNETAEGPAKDLMPRLVKKRWKRLRRAVRALGDEPTPLELHAVRILAKRVRYATEAVAPAVKGSKVGMFARGAAEIQGVLGELNDATVARAWLADASLQLNGQASFAAGQLAQQLANDSQAHLMGWREAYGRMKQNRGWLS